MLFTWNEAEIEYISKGALTAAVAHMSIMDGENDLRGDSSLLKKGLLVLLSFRNDQSQSISEISRKTLLPFSTTSRILKALEEEGFLERTPRGKHYQLGLKCYLLGTLARESGFLRRAALPAMGELRQRFQETVILYIREGDLRVYYDQLAGPQNLKRLERVGSTAPLWAGSASRCLLAYETDHEIGRLLKDVTPLCSRTITDKALIAEKIKAIRTSGYDISVSEREEGVCSVSSPIMDSPHQVVACLTITGPALRFTPEVLDDMIPALKEESRKISERLQDLSSRS